MYHAGFENLPAGRAALERSHVATVLSSCSTIRGDTPSLGMRAIESMVFVGAARRVAGASARTKVMVFVKIIVEALWSCVTGGVEIGSRCNGIIPKADESEMLIKTFPQNKQQSNPECFDWISIRETLS